MAKLAITYYMKNGSTLEDTCSVSDYENLDSAIQDRVKQSATGLQGSTRLGAMTSDTLAVSSSEIVGVRFSKCTKDVTMVHIPMGETYAIDQTNAIITSKRRRK